LYRYAAVGGRLPGFRVGQFQRLFIDHSRRATADLSPPTEQPSVDGAVLPDQEIAPAPGDAEEKLEGAEVSVAQPQIVRLDLLQRGVEETAFLGVTILG